MKYCVKILLVISCLGVSFPVWIDGVHEVLHLTHSHWHHHAHHEHHTAIDHTRMLQMPTTVWHQPGDVEEEVSKGVFGFLFFELTHTHNHYIHTARAYAEVAPPAHYRVYIYPPTPPPLLAAGLS